MPFQISFRAALPPWPAWTGRPALPATDPDRHAD